jgi:hypothetical protein
LHIGLLVVLKLYRLQGLPAAVSRDLKGIFIMTGVMVASDLRWIHAFKELAKIEIIQAEAEDRYGARSSRLSFRHFLAEQHNMKNRLTLLWLAGLTVFVSFTIYDNYRILRNLETGQYYTILYMEKSSAILHKIKHSSLVEEDSPDSHPIASGRK